MRYTNLELVNKCLDTINDDRVTSISGDRPLRVLSIIEDMYYDLLSRHNLPYYESVETLTSAADANTPTLFNISDAATDHVKNIMRVEYNTSDNPSTDPDFRELKYITPDEFLELSEGWENFDVVTITSGAIVKIGNDLDPSYYTSFDQRDIWFNSYDSAVASFIPTSRTRATFRKIPAFAEGDSAVQDVDDVMWPHFLRECQSMSAAILSDGITPKIEQAVRKNRFFNQNDRNKVHDENPRPKYGR